MTEKVVSFLLVDENEEIQVTNEEDFIRKLDCKPDQHLKVVSIFGNTGDGKSHTLNHTFFYGREVFKTSPAQESCTVGVWAAYDPVHKVAVIDTEGLLGATVNLSQRTRLLLKVLAWMSPCPPWALLLSFSMRLFTLSCWALITPQRCQKSSSRTGSGSWAASLKPSVPSTTRERGLTTLPLTSLGFDVLWSSS